MSLTIKSNIPQHWACAVKSWLPLFHLIDVWSARISIHRASGLPFPNMSILGDDTGCETHKCIILFVTVHVSVWVCYLKLLLPKKLLILTRFLINNSAAPPAVQWQIIPVLKEHGKTGSAYPTPNQKLARLTFTLEHGI